MTVDRGVVVVIEDDHHISDLVTMYLRRDGFRVSQADDGETGLAAIERERPVLVIVDLGLPGSLDGYGVCRRLRPTAPGPGSGDDTPVLILSARDDEVDRVLAFELGADDYVTKPFSTRELVARVHAILRRSQASVRGAPRTATVGGVVVDLDRHEARVRGEPMILTTREFELLAFMTTNAGLVLSRRQLLDGAWGRGWFGDERTVDVHVRQLRRKLGPDLPLATVRGVGYRLG